MPSRLAARLAARFALPLLLAGALGAQPTAAPAPVVAGPRGTVRADTLRSAALGTRKQFLVYLPPSYAAQPARRYPVAYYLHGLWGNETNWTRAGHLDAVMDSLVAAGGPEMIVVMPDGDDSWYTTWNALVPAADCLRDTTRREPAAAYCVPWQHYDDYVARDLVARVDSAYRTLSDRRHRAIAGLSMGGYGAVSLALRYPDVWSAAASHSGVLSPLYAGGRTVGGPPPYAADMDSLRAGYRGYWTTLPLAFGRDTAGWWARDPVRLARRLRQTRPRELPALFVDVGTDDMLVGQNRAFHWELQQLRIPHAYAEWPGAHSWAYWRDHVAQSLAWIGARIADAPPRVRKER